LNEQVLSRGWVSGPYATRLEAHAVWTFTEVQVGKSSPRSRRGWRLSPGFQPISANLKRGPWVGEWPLCRRGRLIVATRCLGSDAESPVPEGRSKSLSVPLSVPEIFVLETEFIPLQKPHVFLLKGMLASNLSRDPLNRLAGTGLPACVGLLGQIPRLHLRTAHRLEAYATLIFRTLEGISRSHP
jgi:hypothetical protein